MSNEISPLIIEQPRNTTGKLFSTVTLRCLAEGNPRPEISWYKDRSRVSGSSSQLIIEELKPSNRGFYHCEAVNSAGMVQSQTVLVNIEGM